MIDNNDITKEMIIEDMKSCKQTEGVNVLEHGVMVHKYYEDLISHLTTKSDLLLLWKLPEWIYSHKDIIIDKLFEHRVMKYYQIYHDCGKPYCCTIDNKGKQHFNNHAKVSGEVSKILFPNDEIIHKLIYMDMDIHTLKSDNIVEFSQRTEAISLLITGLCEIHANASMFGGIGSVCFKIKWKHIALKGKKILSLLNNND